jgi:hypothetical protein
MPAPGLIAKRELWGAFDAGAVRRRGLLGEPEHAKAELIAALRSPQYEDFVDASIRQFCARAKARLQECADFDAKRQFLLGHVERVIYNRYKVTLVSSVPVQSTSGDTKLQFRIEGEIDPKAVRSRPRPESCAAASGADNSTTNRLAL